MRKLDMVGAYMGGVTGIRPLRSQRNRIIWLWRCDCGTEFERDACSVNAAVKRFGRTSCGCKWLAAVSANGRKNRTHGLSADNKRLFDIYRHMLGRCYNTKSKDYVAWGERGINVCEEWRNDPRAFERWALANGYQPDLTIERRDFNGNYCPENCTWIPNEKQGQNTRKCRMLTFRGETLPVNEWTRRLGFKYHGVIIGRLNRGWSVERALATPSRGRGANHLTYSP